LGFSAVAILGSTERYGLGLRFLSLGMKLCPFCDEIQNKTNITPPP
jgi:hypothetical protein